MESGYTKEYYQNVILSDTTKNVKINGRPAKSVGDMVTFSVIFI
jgi:uncharacterized Zn-binding protein involved in type VI secretion